MKQTFSNIMVIDQNYDATYLAACIDNPKDYQDINDTAVFFNASSTRAFNYVSGVKTEIAKSDLTFNWTFGTGDDASTERILWALKDGDSDGNWEEFWCGEKNNPSNDCGSIIPYSFNKTFTEAGNNWAELTVEI